MAGTLLTAVVAAGGGGAALPSPSPSPQLPLSFPSELWCKVLSSVDHGCPWDGLRAAQAEAHLSLRMWRQIPKEQGK